MIVKRDNMSLFQLSTGIAGKIVQKVSTYHKRMTIIGDFEHIKSKSLSGFM
ncbi:MAG: DUF4180 domain-containing protein [Treponema sp.]|nr:DUF4180 domain-containing protein [Treponema sp.]